MAKPLGSYLVQSLENKVRDLEIENRELIERCASLVLERDRLKSQLVRALMKPREVEK